MRESDLPWYLSGTSHGELGSAFGIDVLPVWQLTTGMRSIRIAIHDHGLSLSHWAISDRCLPGGWFGKSRLVPEAFTGGQSPDHGTKCAILAAGDIDSGGVAPGCSILPVGLASNANADTLTASLCWAARNSDVVLTAWTANAWVSDHAAIRAAFSEGRDGLGTIWIAPVGNTGRTGVFFPSRLSDCIGVGSITATGEVSAISSLGDGLDILAPGCDIRQHNRPIRNAIGQRRDRFRYRNSIDGHMFAGTSASSAITAGAAALLLSLCPNFTSMQIRGLLLGSICDHESAASSRDTTPHFSRSSPLPRLNLATALDLLNRHQLLTTTPG